MMGRLEDPGVSVTILIAGGLAIRTPSDKTFPLIRELVDDLVTENGEEIARVLFLLCQRAKMIAEPAGTALLAAILSRKLLPGGKKVAACISGGNLDLNLLTQIVERNFLIAGLRSKFAVEVPDKPGVLNTLLNVLTELGVNVESISHDRLTPSVPLGHVRITICVRTLDESQIASIENSLRTARFAFERLT